MKKIAIIGLGYVGLPTLTALASTGKFKVIGFDINEEKVQSIQEGDCPIDNKLCTEELNQYQFKVSSSEEVLQDVDVYFICVPTPVLDDYTPDYSMVLNAIKIVSNYLEEENILILESTVNPGTNEEIVKPRLEELTKLKVGKDLILAHCPERINPGDNKWNIYNIPRNLGVLPYESSEKVADIYKSFLKADLNICSSIKVAESTKIVENTFRDVNIAFVNELAQSFDAMGVDLIETIEGASNKPFGYMPFWPGRGVGGHCIAVDPYYLIRRAEQSGFNHRFLKNARDKNNEMPRYSVDKLQDALNQVGLPIKNTKIAILGLSYKENVGDLRESPCIEIMNILNRMGANLQVYEPFNTTYNNVNSIREATISAEAVAVLTPHELFLQNTDLIIMHNPKVFLDGMNRFDPKLIKKHVTVYIGIGR